MRCKSPLQCSIASACLLAALQEHEVLGWVGPGEIVQLNGSSGGCGRWVTVSPTYLPTWSVLSSGFSEREGKGKAVFFSPVCGEGQPARGTKGGWDGDVPTRIMAFSHDRSRADDARVQVGRVNCKPFRAGCGYGHAG
jgi:hypothetical protein